MEASNITIKETVPASRKLQLNDAKDLLGSASKLITLKGKKVTRYGKAELDDDAAAAMLGPTGNLRAPTIKLGKTLIVGFNDDVFREIFS